MKGGFELRAASCTPSPCLLASHSFGEAGRQAGLKESFVYFSKPGFILPTKLPFRGTGEGFETLCAAAPQRTTTSGSPLMKHMILPGLPMAFTNM